MKRLAGKVALVTGSTSGIGRSIAEAFAAEGATVMVTGRRAELGAEIVSGIAAAGGAAIFLAGDLMTGARPLAEAALDAGGGRIDILVNNAATITFPGPTAEVTEQTIDEALAVNIRGPFVLTGVVAERMAGTGGGAVINIGSVNAITGLAGSALYSLTKAANHSMTQCWAAEYGRVGVRVNTLAPGPTETELVLRNERHFVPMVAQTPSGRISQLSEIAAAAVFLASDEASNVHGATLVVDGGYSAVSRVRERR